LFLASVWLKSSSDPNSHLSGEPLSAENLPMVARKILVCLLSACVVGVAAVTSRAAGGRASLGWRDAASATPPSPLRVQRRAVPSSRSSSSGPIISVLAARNGATQGRTSVVSVRGVLRGSLVLVESRLASLVVILGRKREGRIAQPHLTSCRCILLRPGSQSGPLPLEGFHPPYSHRSPIAKNAWISVRPFRIKRLQ
jgi:hypothetical protein